MDTIRIIKTTNDTEAFRELSAHLRQQVYTLETLEFEVQYDKDNGIFLITFHPVVGTPWVRNYAAALDFSAERVIRDLVKTRREEETIRAFKHLEPTSSVPLKS
jgi:hypothetical protein